MKLRREFIVHEAAGETLLVPTGKAEFSGLVRGNETLGAILKRLESGTTEEALVQSMLEDFDAPEDVIRRDVEKAVSALRSIDALEE